MSNLFEEEREMKCEKACPAVGSRTATVCLPVSVCPFAETGRVRILCCGEPEVSPFCRCKGKINGTCDFTVSQKIHIEVPVEFGAKVALGGTYVDCSCTVAEDPDDEFDYKFKLEE